MILTKIREKSRVLLGSLTSEHGLDATRMWQADRLHAFGVPLSGGSLDDAGGLARSGGYTPLNQSISRVVINLFTLTQESIFRAITEML
jgi:hypothetical protein